jgi:hypothetical protein
MAGFTAPHNGEIITTLFVMVHGGLGVREGEDDGVAGVTVGKFTLDQNGAALRRKHL